MIENREDLYYEILGLQAKLEKDNTLSNNERSQIIKEIEEKQDSIERQSKELIELFMTHVDVDKLIELEQNGGIGIVGHIGNER